METKQYLPSSSTSVGRRMDRESIPKGKKGRTVTPDLVILRGSKYGIVGEVKYAFHEDKPKRIKKLLDQLFAYDDNLTGWPGDLPTETVGNYDIVLLVHDSKRKVAGEFFKTKFKNSNPFTHCFAVVGFSDQPQVEPLIKLERGYGKLSDSNLDKRLYEIIPIRKEALVGLRDWTIYDEKPPIPYTLDILWKHIFSQLADRQDPTAPPGKTLDLTVDQEELVNLISETYCPPQVDSRDPKLPKMRWITEALHALAEMGYAKRVPNSDTWIIRYVRKGHMKRDRFAEKLVELELRKKKKVVKEAPKKALDLFSQI